MSPALALILAVGVGVRLGLLLHWPGRLNVDESVAALMGLHVLRGEFPVFMYSIAYQGAGESYLTAVVYALLGASALTAKLVAFLFSCALILLTYTIGRRLAGSSGGLVAGLLAALGPPFLLVYGNFAMLGYMEVVVVGSLVLLLALDIAAAGPDGPRRTRRLLVLGLVAGLGWWINPMILSYLAAAGIYLLLTAGPWSARALALAVGAFLLGSLPFWIFNASHGFWSFVLFRKGGARSLTRGLRAAFDMLLAIVGVHGIRTDPVPYLSAAAGLVLLGLLGILLVVLARSARGRPGVRAQRRGVGLLVLFCALHLAAFVASRYAELPAERYLFPLYSALPVLTGLALLHLWRWSRPLAVGALALVLLNHGLALGKTVSVYEAGRREDWWRPAPLVAFLEAAGVTRAYADERVAARLTFETQERIVVTDYDGERYRPYRETVGAASRVAYVLTPKSGIAPDPFEATLRGIGARYRREDIGPFSVFHDFRAAFDGPLVGVPPRGWRAQARPAGSDPTRAFDREPDTAWLSEAFLAPGMTYELDLGEAVTLAGVTALPLTPRLGVPRGFRVEVSADGATWDTVASVPEFVVTLTWRGAQPRLERSGQVVSRFAPRPVRHVRLVQVGESREAWWAIAEIFVLGPGAGVPAAREAAAAQVTEGLRLERARRWAAALAAYERAARLDPEWEQPYGRMVEVYRAVRLPLDGTEPYRRGLVFEQLGQWRKAARQYEALLRQPLDSEQATELRRRLGEVQRRQAIE